MPLYDSRKIHEILSENDPDAKLDSLVEIEELIGAIEDMDRKISFNNDTKKHRAKKIKDVNDLLEERKDYLKTVIKNTLDHFGEKSLSIVDVGRVSKRNSTEKWVIDDETALLKELKKHLPKEDLKDLFTLKPVIDKKKVNTVLDNLRSQGIEVESAEVKIQPEGLMISMDKDFRGEASEFEQMEDEL